MSTADRGAAASNMGDGDLVDPAIHDVDDSELVDAPAGEGSAGGWVADPAAGDPGDERASEIDDISESIARPDPSPPTADEHAAVGAAEPDYGDVDVAALLAEREEYRALAQRVQADFDNYRKRAVTQTQAEADRATGRLAEALLPVLDAAEVAYLRHPDEIGPLLNQMLVELKKQGLETLDLDGQPFDPEVAEAVAHEPRQGGEPVVAEVLRSGYRWKGRTLRPAMVKTTD